MEGEDVEMGGVAESLETRSVTDVVAMEIEHS